MNPIELPSKDSKKPKDLLPSRHHSRFSMNIEHALEFAGFVGFVAGGLSHSHTAVPRGSIFGTKPNKTSILPIKRPFSHFHSCLV